MQFFWGSIDRGEPAEKVCGDLMTLQEWLSGVRCGLFIDYDGWGNYAHPTWVTGIRVRPSDVAKGRILSFYTHIMWYNR